MTAEIRAGTVSDIAAIAEIHCDAALTAYADIFPATSPWPSPASLTPSWIDLLNDASSDVFAASVGNDVCGAAVLRLDAAVPAGQLLTRLYVSPSRWGEGIGSQLHDHVLSVARKRSSELINLWVLERNERARGMYERRGWKLVPGRYLPNDPPSVRDVLYERCLSS